ncbi:MAG: hypothetical protein MUF76_11155 [Hydrogenophaga sp.]|jgi:hypothetical protein|nr:hypothetical protein [Hydrogenophaga sp.]
MKTLIWVLFVVLAGLWTGLVAITGQLTEWLLGAVASGQASDLAGAVGQWPVPAWLGLWVDTAWLQAVQAATADMLQWLGQWLPGAGSLMAWITPLLWTGWLLVLLTMLVLAGLGHWLVGRFAGTSAGPRLPA